MLGGAWSTGQKGAVLIGILCDMVRTWAPLGGQASGVDHQPHRHVVPSKRPQLYLGGERKMEDVAGPPEL